MLIPNHVAVHTHPRYWGSDCLKWRPSRWIQSKPSIDSTNIETLDDECLVTPQKGSFIAWSEGVRNCPGKKFSQVEFVASIAALFRDWRVDPVPEPSESLEMARKRGHAYGGGGYRAGTAVADAPPGKGGADLEAKMRIQSKTALGRPHLY